MHLARFWLVIGALYGLLSLVAGTAGAHYLPESMEAGARRAFDVAARFQMFHAVVLLVVGLLTDRWKSRLIHLAGGLFVAGVLLFCGSLYILALAAVGAFGAVAPIGGATLMLGWASLLLGAIRQVREAPE